ncbi:MAG: alpha/beta fold hydrolase [Pirellulaceae bacterium]|nr:alpha/beta fold hydrolase [Pirellulaceae bacterium]
MAARFVCRWIHVLALAALLPVGGIRAQEAAGEKGAGEKLPADKAAASPELAGIWAGELNLGVAKLRLVVEFKKQEDGGYAGTMDSPDQNAFGMPIDEVLLDKQSIKFTMKKIGGAYAGELSANGKEIKGTWKQGLLSLPLVLKPGEKAGPLARPQEPKAPLPYRSEEVTYEDSKSGIKFAGTLTLPKEGGPFPAVLLISGSGPQDRNEEIAGHKPFLVLADYLTRRGIAVLRVDDRGIGGTSGKPLESTIEDHASDALAGVAFLKSRAEIDRTKIGLVGHSEGGLVAPAAAVRSREVAFIVLLAGTGVTGEEILYRQGELIAVAGGATPEAAAKNVALQRKLFAVLKNETDQAAAQAKVEAIAAEQIALLSDEEKKQLEGLEEIGKQQLKMLFTPWFRHFLTYDPAPVLAQVKCPVLAINGEKDLQVDPKQNLPTIEAALKAGGHANFVIQELPGLNHLFQTCKTGSPSEYGQIEETFNPAALTAVGDWIAKQAAAK